MHNNIMAAGSKDRPPMLGPGRYSQWHSRFLRYLDTKSNGEYLRKCIFDGPYMPTNVLIAAVEAAENILPVAAHEEVETIHNMTAENKLYFQAEKEAIFLILTGIGDEIYSTVDACNTSKEMWTAIERLQQGESLNVQDVKTNLFWEFGNSSRRWRNPENIEVRSAKRLDTSALTARDLDTMPGNAEAKADPDEEIDEQELEAHYSYMAKIQEVSPANHQVYVIRHGTVQNHYENDVSANVRRHTVDQNAAECVDERAALANLIANLTLDMEENKTILKQLKKANASLTQELKECKTNLDETSRALSEATSSRIVSPDLHYNQDSNRLSLESYTGPLIPNEYYKILKQIVNQKHDELVKKSLLNRSQFEGQLKEKTKVISDLKVKEGKDIDTMIEMGTSLCANPKYCKKAQSNKPCLYEIPYDTSDPANRFAPDGEDIVTLEKESRSKLDKDKTSNVNALWKDCVFNTDHDACVSRYVKTECPRTKKLRIHFVPMFQSSSNSLCNCTTHPIHMLTLDHKAHETGNLKLLLICGETSGLPKLKYVKDQLCSSCEMSKAKRSSFKTKAVPSSKGRLNLLHMDLCGPMRVASINGKKYILVIVDDYSRYTWTLFLRSKDETPEGSAIRLLSASKLPLSFWAEAVATACYTQNRSIIISTHGKTAYHIINDRKPLINSSIFGCTCYITRDGENLDKMKEKGDPCVMVGYSTQSKGYRVYNKRTRLIVESIHIKFDEIKEMILITTVQDLAPQQTRDDLFENVSSGLVPQGQKASDYDNSAPVPQTNDVPSAEKTKIRHNKEEGIDFEESFAPLLAGANGEVNVAQPEGFRRSISTRKSLPSKKALYGIKQASKEPAGCQRNKTALQCLQQRQSGVICKLCSSNVDEDTTSRLWLQL
ncbi:retrovirus-related pol polyprotein from transposon TNT 1-94 [Tanacetum coccineum]